MTWSTGLLGDVAEIVSGSTPKTGTSEFWDGEIPWATPADLSKLDGHFIARTPRNLTELGLKSSGAKMLPAGSVLFSSRAPIGHVAITSVPMSTNQGFKSLVPNPGMLDAKFLFWWLRANKVYLQGLGVGATFKEVSKSIVSAIRIPLPPLPEQRRIASILDQADELRAKRRRALALLDELGESVVDRVFAGKAIRTDLLAEHLNFLTSGSRGWAQYYADAGAPFLRIQNVGRDALMLDDLAHVVAPDNAEAKRTMVQCGDVLLSITADLGRTAVVDDSVMGAHVNQHLAILRSSTLNSRYLSRYLTSGRGMAQLLKKNRSAVKDGLNFDDIRSVEIPIVSREKQAELASRLTTIDGFRLLHSKSLANLNELFASLQYRAFNGGL